MARFGSKVTVFAKSAEILGKEDRDAAAIVYKQLQADGVAFKMNAKYHMVKSGGPQGQEIHIQLDRLHEDQGKVTLLLTTWIEKSMPLGVMTGACVPRSSPRLANYIASCVCQYRLSQCDHEGLMHVQRQKSLECCNEEWELGIVMS